MKKISWFKRLFMSWDSLAKYFNQSQSTPINQDILQERQKRIDELTEWLNEKKQFLIERDKEITLLLEKIRNLEGNNKDVENNWQKGKENEVHLQSQLKTTQENYETLRKEVAENLRVLPEIQKTFFGKTGSKGRGQLGELQLENILTKSDISSDTWTKNLMVGQDQVEFALKADHEDDKWIPVDSKVLMPEINSDDQTMIIDEEYSKRVLVEVKKVSKYLSKKNTSDYGLLVLQNDEIYMKLFTDYPNIFNISIKDHHVFILSPSSFIQYAWTLSNILKIYKRIQKDQELFDLIEETLTSVTKFANKIKISYDNMTVAMDTHYPTIEKRGTRLIKKLEKEDKLSIKSSKEKNNLIGDKNE